jgi:hypothetical protein
VVVVVEHCEDLAFAREPGRLAVRDLLDRFSSRSWSHGGSLPGTRTEIARTAASGNYNFVILTNTRSTSPTFLSELDGSFWAALSATPQWPDIDLFNSP